ncbi:MAG: cupin domain-containing protein [Pseudomonadota bacterium]
MPPLKVNIRSAAESQIAKTFDPHIVGDINDYQVKVAKFGEVFDWHSHENEDEGFLVLKGRIVIDFRDGAVELDEGDFMVVPKNVEHRPRSLTNEPVVLMFEPANTLNTGNLSDSELTVNNPKRLV